MRWVRRLNAMRGEGEDYSDVVVRLAAVEREALNVTRRLDPSAIPPSATVLRFRRRG
jgi:hypothetical protein